MSWSVLACLDGCPTSICFSSKSPSRIYLGYATGDIYQLDWSFLQSIDARSVENKLCLEARIPELNYQSIALDSSGSLLVTDMRHQAVLRVSGSTSYSNYASAFENCQLSGPHSVCGDSSASMIAFTDAGMPGETGLHRSLGSLFLSSEQGVLLCLCHKTLASPGSLCFDATGRNLYVIEKGKNRVLQFYQQPDSKAWEGRVYLQLGGSREAIALVAPDNGKLIIAFSLYDGSKPIVRVYNNDGALETILPEFPGMYISSMTLSPERDCLVAVDKGSKQLFTYRLTN